jgi:hypothetical protein
MSAHMPDGETARSSCTSACACARSSGLIAGSGVEGRCWDWPAPIMDAVAIRSGRKQWRYIKIQLLTAIVLQAYLKEAKV